VIASLVAISLAGIKRNMMNRLNYTLPADLQAALNSVLDEWQLEGNLARLWRRDAALWSNSDEADWLGWLNIAGKSLAHSDELESFARDLSARDIRQVVLLGMGGSSMAPEVIAETFGQQPGYPELMVLDSTDPGQINAVDAAIDPEHTAFIVASKSGSSLEPNILMAFFLQRLTEVVGAEKAASHFIAITDPGTSLDKQAAADGFMQVFNGEPDIGGRFSVLSVFGTVPAAICGIDCRRFLDNALKMTVACESTGELKDNPGVLLGCILGTAANAGRDKLTIITSSPLASMGAWLEQLVAESTGKQGKGIIPVDGESLTAAASYGNDRVFMYFCLAGEADPEQEKFVARLEQAGEPVVRITLDDRYALGQEFFRWEMATAVAGSLMGVNPFDQPDVEASKVEARRITEAYKTGGRLSADKPLATDGQLMLFTDARNAAELTSLVDELSVGALLKAHFGRVTAGDYVALLAYLDRNDTNTVQLQQIRDAVRQGGKTASCVGFGPRFLHSTGQAYKGGPNTGVFLQITADAAEDIQVPGQDYTFGVVEAAQAQGDLEVLAERGRRVVRVHLGNEVAAGLAQLNRLLAD
jgi:transaldolase/glucose-6-phosphate isomerase